MIMLKKHLFLSAPIAQLVEQCFRIPEKCKFFRCSEKYQLLRHEKKAKVESANLSGGFIK